MRWLSIVALVCAGAAMAMAYSVTPNVAVGIGGAADEAVMGVAGDAAGSYYAVGWTLSPLLNSSFAAGGPTVTTYYAATYAKAGEAKNGFVTKYSKYGIPQWSAYVGGVADQTVNAVAVSSSQTTVVVCGSYSGADAYIAYGAGSNQALSTPQQQDVFVAGFSASTGALVWSFGVHANLDDDCLTIAEHNGLVAYGGYAFAGPGTATNRFDPDGRSANKIRSWNPGSPTAYVGQCATADAAISGRLMSNPTFSHNSPSFGYSGVTRALTFDSVGNLWAATTIEYMSAYRAPFSGSEVEGTHDVGVTMYPASAVPDQTLFENYGPNLASCANSFALNAGLPLDPACVTYPGTFPYGIAQASYFGSDGDDIVTGISVQNMPGDVWANLTFTNSRVVLTGYTVGATAGSTFKVHQYFELTDPSAFAENAPASAFDFVLPNSGEVGWWMAQNASFNADGGAAFYAKALPSGLSGRINSVACDVATQHCVVAASLQGSGSVNVLGSGAKTVASVNGSRDAFVMRVNATGDIMWLEQSGGAGYDAALSVVLFSGAGLARPGQWAAVGGYFTTGALGAGVAVTPNSASPIVVGGRGGADGLMVSYDDVDDCGLDTSLPLTHPYGNNACGLNSNLNALGASLCLDEPGFPVCFCHMNVTNASPVTFCDRRGWNCAFMPQYYYGLLDMCDCPAAQNPHANPLLDVAGRLQSCAGNVCQFGALTGVHANCLPLVLDLMNTCGASPDTPAADQLYIGLFRQFYNGCGATTTPSSTAVDCTGFDFCAAPRAAQPASALVTALATAAAALLIAAASHIRRS